MNRKIHILVALLLMVVGFYAVYWLGGREEEVRNAQERFFALAGGVLIASGPIFLWVTRK